MQTKTAFYLFKAFVYLVMLSPVILTAVTFKFSWAYEEFVSIQLKKFYDFYSVKVCPASIFEPDSTCYFFTNTEPYLTTIKFVFFGELIFIGICYWFTFILQFIKSWRKSYKLFLWFILLVPFVHFTVNLAVYITFKILNHYVASTSPALVISSAMTSFGLFVIGMIGFFIFRRKLKKEKYEASESEMQALTSQQTQIEIERKKLEEEKERLKSEKLLFEEEKRKRKEKKKEIKILPGLENKIPESETKKLEEQEKQILEKEQKVYLKKLKFEQDKTQQLLITQQKENEIAEKERNVETRLLFIQQEEIRVKEERKKLEEEETKFKTEIIEEKKKYLNELANKGTSDPIYVEHKRIEEENKKISDEKQILIEEKTLISFEIASKKTKMEEEKKDLEEKKKETRKRTL